VKRIPTSFQLGAYTIQVKLLDAEAMEAKTGGLEVYGLFAPEELTIYLEKPSRSLKKAIIVQTFWHEYFHAMFWVAGHKDQYNEQVVDRCGHLTYQMITTAKFDGS
jgi:hypothetical protein